MPGQQNEQTEQMGQIYASIFRYNPAEDQQPHYQTYAVPVKRERTLQALLEDIYENYDHTLAFRKGKCYQGICGRCLVKLNGKPVRACSTIIKAGETVQVDPVNNDKVLKDLVTQL